MFQNKTRIYNVHSQTCTVYRRCIYYRLLVSVRNVVAVYALWNKPSSCFFPPRNAWYLYQRKPEFHLRTLFDGLTIAGHGALQAFLPRREPTQDVQCNVRLTESKPWFWRVIQPRWYGAVTVLQGASLTSFTLQTQLIASPFDWWNR